MNEARIIIEQCSAGVLTSMAAIFLQDCNQHLTEAMMYYASVRAFGWHYFNYKKNDKWIKE